MNAQDNSLLESVDARTKLVRLQPHGDPALSLGTHETFGINVFKVRESQQDAEITKSPNMPARRGGLISLRGANVIPVLSLARTMALKRCASGLGRGR